MSGKKLGVPCKFDRKCPVPVCHPWGWDICWVSVYLDGKTLYQKAEEECDTEMLKMLLTQDNYEDESWREKKGGEA